MKKSIKRLPCAASFHKQQGAVLMVSLILLVAITVIGLSSLRGTATNELITSNMHQKSISFQVSESLISGVWDMKSLLDSTAGKALHDPIAETAYKNTEFDQPKVDLEASSSIQYCGENNLPIGSSLSSDESAFKLAAQVFDVHGLSSIASSNVVTDHLQRGYVVRPVTGRTGNCPA
jgi:type IV pilus assembly protein PilX